MNGRTLRRASARSVIHALAVALTATTVLPQDAAPMHEGAAPPIDSARAAEDAPRTIGSLFEPGESTGDVAPADITSASSGLGALLRLVGWTIAVLAAGGAVLMLVRKYTPAGRLLGGDGMVQVLGRTSLSPRHSLYAVRVGGQRLLIVGVSGDRMVALSEISDAAEMLAVAGGFRATLADAESEEQGASRLSSRLADPAAMLGARAESGRREFGDEELQPFEREIRKLRGVIRGWRSAVARGFERRAIDSGEALGGEEAR